MKAKYINLNLIDPKTKKEVNVPVLRESLLNKSREEIKEIIAAIIKKEFKQYAIKWK